MPISRKILIVDDDAELRDALREQFSLLEEFEAIVAENGSRGVEAARAGQVDLAIMDVGLPDIDGREAVLLARIRAHLRQYETSEHATFAIGPYKFRPSAKALVINPENSKVHLT